MAAVLLGELIYAFSIGTGQAVDIVQFSPQQVSITLFGPYLLGVELASILLLAGLVGAYHLGRHLK
jgi:NADH-quinone oxidoreductase subunit J